MSIPSIYTAPEFEIKSQNFAHSI